MKYPLSHVSGASIHFPLAREDSVYYTTFPMFCASIHFPLAREDSAPSVPEYVPIASIHFPLAREDFIDSNLFLAILCFNPLPSCEGRLPRTHFY